jgi:putative GTP pyrophosphokinase
LPDDLAHGPLLALYDDVAAALAARGEQLRVELDTLLRAEPSLKIHAVTLRLKDRSSLEGKLARPDRSYADLWDVTDLVGLRVTTYFEDAVDRVGGLLEQHLPIDLSRSTDKRRRRDASAFGYRSLHYVCRLGADGAALPAEACCEIQIRTVLDHAWAEIEHDLGYKSRDTVPAAARRRLTRLAGLLELADQEFLAIRRELDDYAKALPDRIAAEGDAVALDRLSLQALLDCDEVRDLDLAIARSLGRDLGTEPFFPPYLLRMLAFAGIRSVASARAGARTHATTIVEMVRPYFAFAWREWRLSPARMNEIPRGYSLFFLVHASVLHDAERGLDKVERLTHLYGELDYPDDARAAQRVATSLVEAFGEAKG